MGGAFLLLINELPFIQLSISSHRREKKIKQEKMWRDELM